MNRKCQILLSNLTESVDWQVCEFLLSPAQLMRKVNLRYATYLFNLYVISTYKSLTNHLNI